MPNKQEKQQQVNQKKVSTAPTQSWWQRIFGSSPMTPEMQEGINIARQEMPDLGQVENFGPISRLLMGNTTGYVSPGRTMYLNPSALGTNPQDIADTITHEQQHVRQMKQRNLNPVSEFLTSIVDRSPYHQRPDEMEAYRAEFARRARMNRSQSAIPSFSTGEFYTPANIRLRGPKTGINTAPSSGTLKQMVK